MSSEVFDGPTFARRPNHPLKPRHLKTHKLDGAAAAQDPVLGRQHLLANADVRISYSVADQPSPLYTPSATSCVYVEERLRRGRASSAHSR